VKCISRIASKAGLSEKTKRNATKILQNAEEQKLVAYVTAETSSEESEFFDRLGIALQQHLPDYMIPSVFVMLKQFPLTTNGKIDRKSLPEPEAAELSGKYLSPEGNLELTLVAIWSELLKIPQVKISANANFFKLGGHSLLIAKLINDVNQKLDFEMAYKDVFNFPTLRRLSTMINEEITTNTLMNSLEESGDDSVEELEW
jgi:acyl carrier protein